MRVEYRGFTLNTSPYGDKWNVFVSQGGEMQFVMGTFAVEQDAIEEAKRVIDKDGRREPG